MLRKLDSVCRDPAFGCVDWYPYEIDQVLPNP